jgi:hypothetical protein
LPSKGLYRHNMLSLRVANLAASAWDEQHSMPRTPNDWIEHPPLQRAGMSSSERFRLIVEPVDSWQRPAASATLLELDGAAAASAWAQPIPQQLGPRDALVTDDERVLMIDEGINVRSRYTLMLFDPLGHTVARPDFAALVQATGATEPEIKAHAQHGPWMAEPSMLAPDGRAARARFAGHLLAVSLIDGSLTPAR